MVQELLKLIAQHLDETPMPATQPFAHAGPHTLDHVVDEESERGELLHVTGEMVRSNQRAVLGPTIQ
jgi:hypothetical protein